MTVILYKKIQKLSPVQFCHEKLCKLECIILSLSKIVLIYRIKSLEKKEKIIIKIKIMKYRKIKKIIRPWIGSKIPITFNFTFIKVCRRVLTCI